MRRGSSRTARPMPARRPTPPALQRGRPTATGRARSPRKPQTTGVRMGPQQALTRRTTMRCTWAPRSSPTRPPPNSPRRAVAYAPPSAVLTRTCARGTARHTLTGVWRGRPRLRSRTPWTGAMRAWLPIPRTRARAARAGRSPPWLPSRAPTRAPRGSWSRSQNKTWWTACATRRCPTRARGRRGRSAVWAARADSWILPSSTSSTTSRAPSTTRRPTSTRAPHTGLASTGRAGSAPRSRAGWTSPRATRTRLCSLWPPRAPWPWVWTPPWPGSSTSAACSPMCSAPPTPSPWITASRSWATAPRPRARTTGSSRTPGGAGGARRATSASPGVSTHAASPTQRHTPSCRASFPFGERDGERVRESDD
mmetsp:Transcript_6389/g.17320  ORF Transcript_6389/g.17320 Transcript_6389/m.17320 type:complete len:367 (-) Transcript_6389:300-1400(-)